MEVSIQSLHFDASSQLIAFIQKKMEKLDQISDDVITAEVTLRLVNSEEKKNKEASILMLVKGEELFSSKINETFEESVDLAIDALKKQLERYKEKIAGR